MAACPEDGSALEPTTRGLRCARCTGTALEADALERLAPGLVARLTVETERGSAAFQKLLRCPGCEATMTPLRAGRHGVWLFRCPSCQLYWANARAVEVLRPSRTVRRPEPPSAAAATARASRDLPQTGGELHPLQVVLAWFGMPVVLDAEGDHPPILTVSLCLLLSVVFVFSFLVEAPGLTVDELGYDVGTSGPFGAVTANLAHAGWAHLLGNLYFLFTFGGAIEHKVPRWVISAAFFVVGPATLLISGAFDPAGVLIVGASGAIAVLMGMCFVLQPRARVFTPISMLLSPLSALFFLVSRLRHGEPLVPPAVRVPLWAWGLFELATQFFMLWIGVRGVAWIAHASGLLLGVALGFISRRAWPLGQRRLAY